MTVHQKVSRLASAYDVVFFPVDRGSRGGDAILVRYSSANYRETSVIDFGYEETFEEYKHLLPKRIDYVFNTHFDGDHIGGLLALVQKHEIGEICMTFDPDRPLNEKVSWGLLTELMMKELSGKIIDPIRRTRLLASIDQGRELIRFARDCIPAIPVSFVTQGAQKGSFWILAPSEEYLKPLKKKILKESRTVTEAKIALGAKYSLVERFIVEAATAANESSILLWTNFGFSLTGGFLFTGDGSSKTIADAVAGATTNPKLKKQNIDLKKLDLFQLPHHGSQTYFKPGKDGVSAPTTVVSAPEQSVHHPSPELLKNLKANSVQPYCTQGRCLRVTRYELKDPEQEWENVTPKGAAFHLYRSRMRVPSTLGQFPSAFAE